MNEELKFEPFPKIPRLNREIVITEKIDGTNAIIHVAENGVVTAGSRTRWITPEKDNYGFAKWVAEHEEELRTGLGFGTHFGEWWGSGVNRGYGLTNGEKRFSLFNVHRWDDDSVRPACCSVVPTFYRGPFSQAAIEEALEWFRLNGSIAARGYMNPEGIVVFHTAASQLFKVTLEKDEISKEEAARRAAYEASKDSK